MKDVPKKDWTQAEHRAVEKFGYTRKLAREMVAGWRENELDHNTELADARRDQRRGCLSLGSANNH